MIWGESGDVMGKQNVGDMDATLQYPQRLHRFQSLAESVDQYCWRSGFGELYAELVVSRPRDRHRS